jgi:hypothetical protein
MKLDNAVGVSTSVELVRGLVCQLISSHLPKEPSDTAVVFVSESPGQTEVSNTSKAH